LFSVRGIVLTDPSEDEARDDKDDDTAWIEKEQSQEDSGEE